MTVSKRTRFEVLKRDNYTCRYCRSAEGALTIDHVVPVALGGSDEPSNLAADQEAATARRAPFLAEWKSWDPDEVRLPSGWTQSVDRWLAAGITVERLVEAIEITLPKRHIRHDEVFRYVAGIVKKWLAELDELTAAELAADGDA